MRLPNDHLARGSATPPARTTGGDAGEEPTKPARLDDAVQSTASRGVAPSEIPVGYAQQLYDWGFNVLPAPVKAKSPSVPWKQWIRDRIPAEQIAEWFPDSGESNYWVAAGPVSGLMLLDTDSEATDRWWRAKLGALLDLTVCARSSKGYHYLFRPPEGEDLRGWSYHDHHDGERLDFDVRGTGGGVIVPPSIHETGVVYEWVRSPADCEMLPLPDALRSRAAAGLEATHRKAPTGTKAAGGLAELLSRPPVGEGSGRNDWLTRVAGHHAKAYRSDRGTYNALVHDANQRCRPPLPDQEAEKVADSIWSKEQQKDADQKEEKKSAATLLVELALASYRFGCTDDGAVFALRPGSHVVRTLTGDKRSLRAELSRAYFRSSGKAPAQQALADAQGVIEGMAQERDPETVNLRVARTGDAVWIDLGDQGEHVLRLTSDGWRVQDTCPVLFSRTALTGALPTPTRNLALDRLWGHLNVSERDRPAVLAWLVHALLQPDMPQPVLALFGEQGTAKSTLTRRLVSLIDPGPVPLRKPPKDPDAWVSAAQGSYVVGLDNLSSIPDWFSDSLCRAATGDGDIRRTLYKDKHLTVFAFRRAVILNGIDVGALRGDLAQRAVVVNLDRLAAYRPEQAMVTEWEADYPGLVGTVLTLATQVLGVLPTITGDFPRMVDYARVLAAVDQVLGTTGTTRYGEQEETLAEDAITANPFLAALTSHGHPFQGTGAKLLEVLEPHAGYGRKPQGWPATPRYVTTLLRRNAPALRKAGWVVEPYEDRHQKVTVWDLKPPTETRDELF